MRMRSFQILFLPLLLAVLLKPADATGRFLRVDDGLPEGLVYAIAADSYSINLGVSDGIKGGEFFLVFYDGGGLFDANGILTGRYKIPVAIIKVKSVSTSGSECAVVSPSKGWVIQRGDRVMLISPASANHLRFATFCTTPPKPELPGYQGRWRRVAPAENPASVIVQHYYPWTDPAAGQYPPGHYYYASPVFSLSPFSAPAAPAAVLPSAGPGAYLGAVQAEPAAVPLPSPVPAPAPLYPYAPWPYDFDVNVITDLRLVRTFPISEVEVYALEIQHRQAWDLYSKKRYREAFEAFTQQASLYYGNYLSPYWAGRCALAMKLPELAEIWFNAALNINPHYQPARDEILKIIGRKMNG
jgi:hypothetical protein